MQIATQICIMKLIKKREMLYLLLFQLIEALALPIGVERATPKPHAV